MLAAVHRGDDDDVERWAALAAGGDRAAFGQLYRHFVGPVFGYCLRALGDRARAEDATAETFLRALAAIPTYRTGTCRGWLFTIAHHVVADEWRRAAPLRPELLTLPATEDPPDAEALAGLDRAWLRESLARLTPEQRDVIALRLAGLPAAEIAAAMGKSRNAVDALQFRAVGRLRRLLPDMIGDD